MIKDFASSCNLINLNKLSTPADKSGEPQNDSIDEELLVLSSLAFPLKSSFLGLWSLTNFDFS
jgi:hypothetical protein